VLTVGQNAASITATALVATAPSWRSQAKNSSSRSGSSERRSTADDAHPIGHLLFQLEGLVEQNQDPQQQQQPTERGLPAEPPPSTAAFYGRLPPRFYRQCDAGTLPKYSCL